MLNNPALVIDYLDDDDDDGDYGDGQATSYATAEETWREPHDIPSYAFD